VVCPNLVPQRLQSHCVYVETLFPN
jgi:hypothetical protein